MTRLGAGSVGAGWAPSVEPRTTATVAMATMRPLNIQGKRLLSVSLVTWGIVPRRFHQRSDRDHKNNERHTRNCNKGPFDYKVAGSIRLLGTSQSFKSA